jgi:hypothetical protein
MLRCSFATSSIATTLATSLRSAPTRSSNRLTLAVTSGHTDSRLYAIRSQINIRNSRCCSISKFIRGSESPGVDPSSDQIKRSLRGLTLTGTTTTRHFKLLTFDSAFSMPDPFQTAPANTVEHRIRRLEPLSVPNEEEPTMSRLFGFVGGTGSPALHVPRPSDQHSQVRMLFKFASANLVEHDDL